MVYSPTGEDCTEEAWKDGFVGIWYGAWSPRDLDNVSSLANAAAAAKLSALPAQKRLRWELKPSQVGIARKFSRIGSDDWVFVYFNHAIHLGRSRSNLLPRPLDKFQRSGELFKAKPVAECKSFPLSQLPEGFRLLACAGRGTLHQVPQSECFIQVLSNSDDCKSVLRKMRQLDLDEWLYALGPNGWESICLGYLILEQNYVPTGLAVGGTLPDFDIVGRGQNGKRIYAQCKKGNTPYCLSSSERSAFDNSKNAMLYLFAYGGAANVPSHVRVITGNEFQGWLIHSPKGRRYKQLLFGI